MAQHHYRNRHTIHLVRICSPCVSDARLVLCPVVRQYLLRTRSPRSVLMVLRWRGAGWAKFGSLGINGAPGSVPRDVGASVPSIIPAPTSQEKRRRKPNGTPAHSSNSAVSPELGLSQKHWAATKCALLGQNQLPTQRPNDKSPGLILESPPRTLVREKLRRGRVAVLIFPHLNFQ